MFHNFCFYSLARSSYSFFFSFSFNFTLWNSKVYNSASLLIITESGRLAKIRWSVCMSIYERTLCVSFSWKDSGFCILLWNSRGISVHAFEFSLAENLSAQHMGCLGVRLKQVLTRVRASGWRCHSGVITVRDDTGWQGAGDVTHRKHAEVCVRIWRK